MIGSLKIAIYFLLFRYKSIFRNESDLKMHWSYEKPNFQQISDVRTRGLGKIEYFENMCNSPTSYMKFYTYINIWKYSL